MNTRTHTTHATLAEITTSMVREHYGKLIALGFASVIVFGLVRLAQVIPTL